MKFMKGTVLFCLDEAVKREGQRVSHERPRRSSPDSQPDDDGEEWKAHKTSAGVEPFFTPNANYKPDQLPKLLGAAIYHTGKSPADLCRGAVEFFFDSRLWRARSSSGKNSLTESLQWILEAAWGLPLAVLANEEIGTVRISIHGDGLNLFADFVEAAARRLFREAARDVAIIRLPNQGEVEEMKISYQLAEEPVAANGSRTRS